MFITATRASSILFRFLKTFPKGKYLLPANICPVVPLTFIKAKVDFDFLDINPLTLCIDENTVKETIINNKNKYSGIVFVRTYGYKYNTTNFFAELKNIIPDFKIIDDKCLCYPDFEPISDFTDMELFSTGYAKTVEIGKGGYAKINLQEKLAIVSENFNPQSYSIIEQEYKKCLSQKKLLENNINDWLDTSDIEIFDYFEQIKTKINEIKKHKEKINSIYKNNINNIKILDDDFNNWRFNFLTENKTFVLEKIFEAKLFASSHYIPSNVLFDKKYFSNAENLSVKIINLFNDFYITEQQAITICEIINKKNY